MDRATLIKELRRPLTKQIKCTSCRAWAIVLFSEIFMLQKKAECHYSSVFWWLTIQVRKENQLTLLQENQHTLPHWDTP